MEKTVIYADARANRAALILSTMSPDMVEDIIYLLNNRSGNVVGDIFSAGSPANAAGIPRPMAILSRAYIADQDFEAVLTGLTTTFVAQLRKPTSGNDFYEGILKDAFSLPDDIAAAMAKKIETTDIIPEGEGVSGWLQSVGRSITDAGRRFLNWGASLINMDWEIDQDQDYDLDMLYEYKLLGEAVAEMNSRARLMKAQMLIKTSSNMMQFGDPGDGGEIGDAELASALSPFMLRTLPPNIMGGASNIWKFGMRSSLAKAKAVVDKAGAEIKPSGQVVTSTGKDLSKSPSVLGSLAKMTPAGMMASGIRALFAKAKSSQGAGKGDPLYGEVEHLYGAPIANSLLAGDIEPLTHAIAGDVLGDYSTGDPDLDALIDDELEDQIGEVEEMGGPFSNLTRNINRRRAAGRKRRAYRSRMHAEKKEQNFLDRKRSKRNLDDAGQEDYDYEPEYDYDDQSDDNSDEFDS